MRLLPLNYVPWTYFPYEFSALDCFLGSSEFLFNCLLAKYSGFGFCFTSLQSAVLWSVLILLDICISRRPCSFPEYFGNDQNPGSLQGTKDPEQSSQKEQCVCTDWGRECCIVALAGADKSTSAPRLLDVAGSLGGQLTDKQRSNKD